MPDEYDEDDPAGEREPGFRVVDRTAVSAAVKYMHWWIDHPANEIMIGKAVSSYIQALVAHADESLSATAPGSAARPSLDG